jgi:hypothetical protein
MTVRLLLATVLLCAIVANAHAQQAARLYAAGPILVDREATEVDCNVHNSGSQLQNPTSAIRIVDPTNANVANFSSCSTTPLDSGNSCTVGVQDDPSVLGELLTCTFLAAPTMAGGDVLVVGTLAVRNQTDVLYVIPLQLIQ